MTPPDSKEPTDPADPGDTPDPVPSPELRDDLVAVARLRTGLVRGEPAEVRAFYPEDVAGLWVIPMFDGDRGRVVVLLEVDGEVVAHGGPDRATDNLRRLFGTSDRPDWLVEEITPVLDAVGGLTPGMPQYPDPNAEESSDGTITLVLEEPVDWVRFAATGAFGPPPAAHLSSGGIAPPPPMGRMVCTITADWVLSWRYEVDDREVSPPEVLSGADEDEAEQAPPLAAEQAIAAARSSLTSPLALPSAPVTRAADGGWTVRLAGHQPVTVA